MYDGQHVSYASVGSKCFAAQTSSYACRVVRQQQVFSALVPILSKVEIGRHPRSAALALALVFSSPDVFGGQLSNSAVAA